MRYRGCAHDIPQHRFDASSLNLPDSSDVDAGNLRTTDPGGPYNFSLLNTQTTEVRGECLCHHAWPLSRTLGFAALC